MPAPPTGGARDDGPWLAVSQVMNHAILDRNGRRAGRVDDVLFDVSDEARQGDGSTAGRASRALVLRAVVSGPLPRPTPRVLRSFFRLSYLACGIRDPRPAVVDWRHVEAIDALVHLDVDRDEAGLRTVDRSVLRVIARIPGSAGRGNQATQPPSVRVPPADRAGSPGGVREPAREGGRIERFSTRRGTRVLDERGSRLGYVVDVIVSPTQDRMVVGRFVLVHRRFDLLLHRFAPRVDAFTIEADRVCDITARPFRLGEAT